MEHCIRAEIWSIDLVVDIEPGSSKSFDLETHTSYRVVIGKCSSGFGWGGVLWIPTGDYGWTKTYTINQ